MIPAPEHDSAAARILVVDDEANIRKTLTRALELCGYAAKGVTSGKEALAALAKTNYAVMLLDLKLPEMDGLETMRRARQVQPDLMVLILTGHATTESAIAAVKSEAIDYLLKPASISDITAAIARALKKRADQTRPQRLLRSVLETLQRSESADAESGAQKPIAAAEPSHSPAGAILRVGAITLDEQTRVVRLDGRSIELTEGEMTILALLMKRADQVLSCRELTRAAWHYDLEEWESQALVRPYIFRLRQKIEMTPGDPVIIRNVRGRGYLLASK